MASALAPILLCLSALLNPCIAGYALEDNYSPSNFFDMFSFYTASDPTNGFVDYVSQSTAQDAGLISTSSNSVYVGVDHENVTPGGRPSVRLTSNAAYNHGLFILDLEHMPYGCGTWPAFWMFGPNWPSSGEIDIIEGVHEATTNSMTLHTGPGCTMTNSNKLFSGSMSTDNCYVDAAGQYANAGCSIGATSTASYGSGFNANGGGVYATEWTSDYISVYFFPRGSIPSDITSGKPDPTGWGTPTAMFQGDCNLDDSIMNQNLVFDITFCGDWAGAVWSSSSCASKATTCNSFVENNPSAFSSAYWSINSLKVYQDNGEDSTAISTLRVSSTSTKVVAAPTVVSVVKSSSMVISIASSKSSTSSSSSSSTSSPSSSSTSTSPSSSTSTSSSSSSSLSSSTSSSSKTSSSALPTTSSSTPSKKTSSSSPSRSSSSTKSQTLSSANTHFVNAIGTSASLSSSSPSSLVSSSSSSSSTTTQPSSLASSSTGFTPVSTWSTTISASASALAASASALASSASSSSPAKPTTFTSSTTTAKTTTFTSINLSTVIPGTNTTVTHSSFSALYVTTTHSTTRPFTATTASTPLTHSTTTATTTAVAASTTTAAPQPQQPGVVAVCNKYYFVTWGDYCYEIAKAFNITTSQFLAWNTGVDSECTNLWAEYYACVGVAPVPSSTAALNLAARATAALNPETWYPGPNHGQGSSQASAAKLRKRRVLVHRRAGHGGGMEKRAQIGSPGGKSWREVNQAVGVSNEKRGVGDAIGSRVDVVVGKPIGENWAGFELAAHDESPDKVVKRSEHRHSHGLAHGHGHGHIGRGLEDGRGA